MPLRRTFLGDGGKLTRCVCRNPACRLCRVKYRKGPGWRHGDGPLQIGRGVVLYMIAPSSFSRPRVVLFGGRRRAQEGVRGPGVVTGSELRRD